MIKFKERLKELRKEKALSQIVFAQAMNVNQATVCTWEIGTREPDFTTLVKIASFFEVSTDYLLGLED